MSDEMIHRGPDDAGIYSDPFAALGHRRLSIIDLSTGKQPISNENKTVWIVFNGEIYNYAELRARLIARGHQFATSTDTEVIVHLYEEYGDECVSHLQGMFAFAIWDSNRRRLLVARDRVGIKPLYFVEANDRLLFSSEIKGLLADPNCPRDISATALHTFLRLGYLGAEETPFSRIRKLSPGCYLTVSDGRVKIQQYWDLEFPKEPRKLSFSDAKAELVELLNTTVRSHMISDVPVGVLLSGGVDSSGILSFAAAHAETRVHTFTIGFDSEGAVDERPYARLTAERVGSQHHEISIGPNEFRDFLPKYTWHMEELVCEPPAIALYYVTKLARSAGVKVLLSGEGGDEAFAGYNTYRNQMRIERIRRLGAPFIQMAAGLLGMTGSLLKDPRFARAAKDLQIPLEQRYASRTANNGGFFNGLNPNVYTESFLAHLSDSSSNALNIPGGVHGTTPLSRMLYIDTKTWLADDLLVKADKITMANSVELRVPLLDHHVLEFAAGLPDNYKVRGSQGKYILKQALQDRVPQEVLHRPKAGFPVPVGRWLGRELASFAQQVLFDHRTCSRGYFRRAAVEQLMADHLREGNRGREIFSLLTLELWHRQFVDVQSAAAVANV
jgi:asparagine synthase (glutamine-hydrolysing)